MISFLTTVNIFIYTVNIFTVRKRDNMGKEMINLKINQNHGTVLIPGISLTQESSFPSYHNNSNPEQQSNYEKINQIFTDQKEHEKTILEARETLGDSAKDLDDGQIHELVSEVQFLVDTWLEEYERKVFNGKTLEELIGLK